MYYQHFTAILSFEIGISCYFNRHKWSLLYLTLSNIILFKVWPSKTKNLAYVTSFKKWKNHPLLISLSFNYQPNTIGLSKSALFDVKSRKTSYNDKEMMARNGTMRSNSAQVPRPSSPPPALFSSIPPIIRAPFINRSLTFHIWKKTLLENPV